MKNMLGRENAHTSNKNEKGVATLSRTQRLVPFFFKNHLTLSEHSGLRHKWEFVQEVLRIRKNERDIIFWYDKQTIHTQPLLVAILPWNKCYTLDCVCISNILTGFFNCHAFAQSCYIFFEAVELLLNPLQCTPTLYENKQKRRKWIIKCNFEKSFFLPYFCSRAATAAPPSDRLIRVFTSARKHNSKYFKYFLINFPNNFTFIFL